MSIVYLRGKIRQLVDLNGDITNFKCEFEIESANKEPFQIVVVNQTILDSDNPLQYQDVKDGYITGDISNNNGIYQNYFCVLRSDTDCDVNIKINTIEIQQETRQQETRNNTPRNNTPRNNTPRNNTPRNNTPRNNAPRNNAPRNNAPIQQETIQQETIQQENFESQPQKQPQKSRGVNWLKIVLIIIVIVLGSLVLWYFYKKSNNSKHIFAFQTPSVDNQPEIIPSTLDNTPATIYDTPATLPPVIESINTSLFNRLNDLDI